ncbi:MAG: hypothetical protein IPN17_34995 [Deltaproteobacteria bacterium]|nr:hypothetical protein [Deltaproteobacteria bacterium]
MNTIDRRDFGAVALGAAAVTLLHGRDADAQPRRPDAGVPLSPNPAEAAIVSLPFAPASLPGLSERMLVSHHDNNYGGAVRKLNEIRTQLGSADPVQSGAYWSLYGSLKAAELAARNSAVLHELYFANLARAAAVGRARDHGDAALRLARPPARTAARGGQGGQRLGRARG